MNAFHFGFACCALAVLTAGADELNFFTATSAGEEAWSWGGAKIRKEAGGWRVTESDPAADYGDVYVADRFPYFPQGVIKLDVTRVEKGFYTLQLVAFHGDQAIGHVEPIRDWAGTGLKTVELSQLQLPAGTESILIKLWAAGAEGATFVLRELLYSTQLDMESPPLFDRFLDAAAWKSDGAVELSKGRVSLAPGSEHGALASAARMPVDPRCDLVFRIAEISNARMTVQLEFFDAAGQFKGPVDVVESVGAGYHGCRLSRVPIPEGSATFGIKLWFSGGTNSYAVLDRLIVAPRP